MKREYFKRLIIKNDLFSLIIITIALILSILGGSTFFSNRLDLNSTYPIFLYATIATLISALCDPLFEFFRVEGKRKKLFTITIGVMASLIIFLLSLYNNSIFLFIQSISKRGGFSAISVSLLLLNIAYINYQLQVSKENEIEQEKQKVVKLLKENLEYKRRNNGSE
ncbi:hypothetical protein [Streptococcus gallinaceus]|uniref:PurR-regulated permease PerM n=1 Tax=Streptococcus gallinaceus TaxID=165758 RepID=A0ABV2JN34_9STRE